MAKIELELDDILYVLWSHGDCIPRAAKQNICKTLRLKYNETQLRAECQRWCTVNDREELIFEGRKIGGPNKLYNDIVEYSGLDAKISRYTDLARG